jgi:hypothetical protein
MPGIHYTKATNVNIFIQPIYGYADSEDSLFQPEPKRESKAITAFHRAVRAGKRNEPVLIHLSASGNRCIL